MRVYQKVPSIWIDRAWDRAEKIVAWYASPEGKASRSRSVSGPWGGEKNKRRQAIAKIGETAGALFFNLDPARDIDWTYDRDGDGDHDLILPDTDARIDVKTNNDKRQECYSSQQVNRLFLKKKFDILLFVSIEDRYCDCWLEGWETKHGFFDRKQIVPPEGYRGLTPDTWYLNKADLRPVKTLKTTAGLASALGKTSEYVRGLWPKSERDWNQMWTKPFHKPEFL